MKKIIALLLVFAMVFTLIAGCSKKDDAEELDLGKEASEENASLETNKEVKENQEIDYILYLRYKDKPFLYDEMLSIDINDDKLKDKSIEEFVLNELIGYKGNSSFESPIPKNTKVLGIERDDKKVIVDLSEDFMKSSMSSSDALLAISGLVNSLVVIPGNETVEIKIEGEALNRYHGVDTSSPLYFFEAVFADK